MAKIGQGIQAGIGILVLAGAAGAFYVFNHDPALKQRLLQDVGVASKPAPQPPANAPVGFNAARTAFVLPHRLGYLPAPELALAKSDPAYAAGLANLEDWVEWPIPTPPVLAGGLPPSSYGGWFYVGGVVRQSRLLVEGTKAQLQSWTDVLEIPTGGYTAGVTLVTTSPVPIHDLAVHALHFSWGSSLFQGTGEEVVTPSMLEIRSAPVKVLPGGLSSGAICVPTSEAILQNGRVITPLEITITAGPSTIFSTDTSGATHGARLFDTGATSCAGFS